MGQVPGRVRGIVFEEEAARAIERRLRTDGYAVTVARERFAGEDDDEDHPWAIETDAPATALDLLLDAHDGWLEDEVAEPNVAAPLELPDAPRLRHR
jgi:8-oxo-dGTP diphosphatase